MSRRIGAEMCRGSLAPRRKSYTDSSDRVTLTSVTVGNTPQAFGEFIQKETIKCAAGIKAAGIKAD